jgi:hypothetical protein
MFRSKTLGALAILAIAGFGGRPLALAQGPPVTINDASPLKILSPRGWVEGSNDRELTDADPNLTVTKVRVIQRVGDAQEVAFSGERCRIDLNHGPRRVFVRGNMNHGKGLSVNSGGSLKRDYDRTPDRKNYTSRNAGDRITNVTVKKRGMTVLDIPHASSPVTIEITYQ